MNKRSIFTFLFTVFFLISCGGQSMGDKQLTAQEFSSAIDGNDDIQLVDVRTADEFEAGHIEGAVNFDWYGNFDAQLADLDKSKDVFVYCLSGGRSGEAAADLRSKGFTVVELKGGMMQWRAAGLPEVGGEMKEEPKALSYEDFMGMMQDDKIVVVDYYAVWCAPCKKMEPFLSHLESDFTNVQLIRVDVDKNQELMNFFRIASIPVIQVYKDKQLVWKHDGFINEIALKAKLTELEAVQ